MKKPMVFFQFFLATGIFIILISPAGFAQRKLNVDTSYYITNPDNLILRLYVARKFAPLTISSSTKEDLNYKTNSKLNLGAGFTYKILTLNFSYGFNFLNKDKGRGDTKGLDLQFHIYPHKWAIDLLGAFLKGYYLDPKDQNGLGLASFYKRPDLSRNIMGLSVFRVANADRFSYRAALNQRDWQKKSAGSLLYGAETYYGIVNADSALVPSRAGSNYTQAGIDKINFFTIGPGIGYAYTLVMSKHLFIMGSAIASINVNISSEQTGGKKNSTVKLIPGGIYKAAMGYNSSTWSVSATLLGNALYAASHASSKEYFLPTGSINLVLARKIGIKKR